MTSDFQFSIRNPQSPIPNPQSVIRNPQSAIPNPQSVIRNPQSVIRNPQSPIPNPQLAIRNPQSPIPNPQLAIRNPQSAIPNPQSAIRNPKIAWDVRMWRHSGIGTHIRDLTAAMARMDRPPQLVCLGPPYFAREAAAQAPEWEAVEFDRRVYGLAGQIAPPPFQPDWSLFHSPHYTFPLRWPKDRPLVVTIHDLIHLDSPNPLKRLYARFFLRRLQARPRRNLRVITVSEAMRRKLLEVLPRLAEGGGEIVRCIPNGVPSRFLGPAPSREGVGGWARRRGLPAEYLLQVGVALPHKNHEFVLKTLLPLSLRGEWNLPLVLCGVGRQGADRLMNLARKFRPDPPVICLPYLPDEEMPLLYAAAKALLLPSLDEGFGLPVLEAQAMGTPVLASDRPVLRETSAGAALFFDPAHSESLAAALKRLMADEAAIADLVRRGRNHARTMTWKAAAEATVRVYEELLMNDE